MPAALILAYIDPGSGTLLLQALLAAALGSLVFLRGLAGRAVGMILPRRGDPREPK